MSALPVDPAATDRWASPVTVGVRLVAGREPARRWGWLAALLSWLGKTIREAGLIPFGIAGLVVAAFLAHSIAGWAVLGVGLIVMDLCHRLDRPEQAGGP